MYILYIITRILRYSLCKFTKCHKAVARQVVASTMSTVFTVWGELLHRYLSNGPKFTSSSNIPIVGVIVTPYNLDGTER